MKSKFLFVNHIAKNKKHKQNMKSKILKVAAFVLLISQTAFGQTVTVTPGEGKGDKSANAIRIPLETHVNYETKMKWVYFTFDAPVKADYTIYSGASKNRFKYILYDENKKEIKKGRQSIEKELEPGTYIIEAEWLMGSSSPNQKEKTVAVILNNAGGGARDDEKAQFSKAPTISLSENIEVETVTELQEKFFSLKVTEAARYQIKIQMKNEEHTPNFINQGISFNRTSARPPCIVLFNEKGRRLLWTEKTRAFGLLPGTYYINASSTEVGDTFSFAVLKEGDEGYKEPSRLMAKINRFEENHSELYMICFVLLGVLVPIILYKAVKPYVIYLDDEYDISFYGVPFIIMLAVLVIVVGLSTFTDVIPVHLQIPIIIGTDILVTIWMCIEQSLKTKNPFILALNIILVHIAFIFAFLLAFFAAILAIIIIVAGLLVLVVFGAFSMGAAAAAVAASGSKACPRCGRTPCTCGFNSY